ncbi:MAG: DegT/DnrJ/EryC1/StrS family aminotransferase [Cyanobacteria bacterium P01_A01_bin.116]
MRPLMLSLNMKEENARNQIEDKLAALISTLPANNLAVFGGKPIRESPYPSWPVNDARDVEIVAEVVRSGRWGGAPYPGPYTATFASQFAQMQAQRSRIAVLAANGSVTMEVALRAANIGWQDEVIVPAYTFQATAAAPMAAGAIPVIVDVDPHTYCISPAAIEAAITPQTRAIIPVHLGAQMADMDAIMAIAQRHNLIVIEDCAHAVGAQWREQGAGTFGHFGSFSLQSNKTLTTGEGGVLLCRTTELAKKAISILDCGRWPQPELEEHTEESTESHREKNGEHANSASSVTHILETFTRFGSQAPAFSMGMNYRMSELQAALGIVALERFEQQVSDRIAMLDYLEEQLCDIPGVRLLNNDPRQTKRSFYRYIFALEPETFGATHEEVCLALHAEGIPCSTGYPAIHRCALFQPKQSKLPVPSAFPERFDFESLHLPEAERACQLDAVWLDESVFRAGKEGVDNAIAALKKVQQNAAILSAAKTAFLEML